MTFKSQGDSVFNNMEINVIANFPGESAIFSNLGVLFKIESWSDRLGVSIELTSNASASDIDQAIVGFVGALQSVLTEVPEGGELRVAVYYTPDEVAAFMVSLSMDAIRLLAETGLTLEVTGFPCLP
ncbi:hypothetical protein KK141_02685 [Dyella sp. LX-66]|uniref:hypothetical protein n=1 Tax=unclassified Dyella TaxID=2634549 RepID=UPI001BE1251A|nr:MULTISPECIES: hypothetical protein [unclassified Dyella]MBT2117375.1 hypothetical protein [Dyella sp. LX-1]MBT2138439.1 hypothetical protein [Dyella sp. LX-66]